MLIRRVPSTQNRTTYNRRKKWKNFFWGLLILLVGVAGWVGITGALALKNITAKNTDETPSFFKFGVNIDPDQLNKEGDSRINVLLLGVDSAAGLTDSIQIASIDPINRSVAMLSVPRDLYVSNPAKGRKSRINEIYRDSGKFCPRATSTCDPNIDYGANALEELLSNILGIKVSYFSKVDFDGLKKLVDSLGGISVYVDKPLSDPTFPDRTYSGFDPFYIGAGQQTMNGATALRYSRCRGGTCGGDFGRARRQQQVILAIRDKITQLNIVTNPQKLTSIMSAAGKGFRTDLSIDQVSQLYKLIKDVDTSTIKTAGLDNSTNGVLKSLNTGGAYLLIPKLGENDWTDVRNLATTTFPEPYLIKEGAKILIVDATGKTGTGELLATKLKRYGYTIIDNQTAESISAKTSVSYYTDNPFTTTFLKKRFVVIPKKVKSPESGEAEIVLTIGSDYLKK